MLRDQLVPGARGEVERRGNAVRDLERSEPGIGAPVRELHHRHVGAVPGRVPLEQVVWGAKRQHVEGDRDHEEGDRDGRDTARGTERRGDLDEKDQHHERAGEQVAALGRGPPHAQDIGLRRPEREEHRHRDPDRPRHGTAAPQPDDGGPDHHDFEADEGERAGEATEAEPLEDEARRGPRGEAVDPSSEDGSRHEGRSPC